MGLRIRRIRRSFALGVLAGVALVACGQDRSAEPASQPAAPAATSPSGAAPAAASAVDLRKEAEEIFSMRCQTCHGPRGAGDGPGSAALDPKPRNFTDAEWQASVDDDHIANIIQYGGVAVGKSPAMPGNPDLSGRPEVVKALVSVIRDLGKS